MFLYFTWNFLLFIINFPWPNISFHDLLGNKKIKVLKAYTFECVSWNKINIAVTIPKISLHDFMTVDFPYNFNLNYT